MSRWGISGAPIPEHLLYSVPVTSACFDKNFPPVFAYAVACRESIIGEMNGKWNAAAVVSSDNGHGLFQLTSWWPDPGWDDPATNAHYAVVDWLLPDTIRWFREYGLTGDALIKCAAASFNAGYGAASAAHERGNVDAVTSDNYGAGVLEIYHNLLDKGTP